MLIGTMVWGLGPGPPPASAQPQRDLETAEPAERVEVRPRPPRYEAIVLDRLEPPPQYRLEIWMPWEITDDGTVYGHLTDWDHYRMFVSRPDEGTRWLAPGEPDRMEIEPYAASTSGAVLLYAWHWPEDWLLLPDGSAIDLNHLHPRWFFPYDMNNRHVIAGHVGTNEGAQAVTYDDENGIVFLEPDRWSAAFAINDLGTAAGQLNAGYGFINMRIWHGDGHISDFVLPRLRENPIGQVAINGNEEVVGVHLRLADDGLNRYGGWYWSEDTGLVEIPFLHQGGGSDRHVDIFGISDDGWVFGKQAYDYDFADYFLWHVDGGFYHLADLYDWEDRFRWPGYENGTGVINADGSLVIDNNLIDDQSARRAVFLKPIRR